MKTWYNKLGFHMNPFSIKPGMFSYDIFGNEKLVEDVSEALEKSGTAFISGDFGTGKTTLLKGVIGKFKKNYSKEKRVVYYNCNKSEQTIDFDRLLINSGSFWSRLFKVKQKEVAILLDEVQDIKKKDIESLKEYYEKGFFRAILLVSKYDDFKLLSELEDLIQKNKFKMKELTPKKAVELVRSRIGELKFLSDTTIQKIFAKNKNPRAFLKNCEDVSRYAFEEEAVEVTEGHIKSALN